MWILGLKGLRSWFTVLSLLIVLYFDRSALKVLWTSVPYSVLIYMRGA